MLTGSRDSGNTIMRALRLAALLALAVGRPVALSAQQEAGFIRGTVSAAENGAKLEGVRVSVEGTVLATLTDRQGRFLLRGVPVGSHTVLFRGIRRAPAREAVTVTLGDTTQVTVSLTERAIDLDDVVVTASREVEARDAVPATVGVIGREAIDGTRPHHPAELVRQVPGALVVDLGGEGNVMALRQPITYKPMYAFLEDGVPLRSTGFFNHNALYEVNIPNADRVEVLKGPATALYGSDAIGGVVNVMTRAPSSGPSAEIFAEGGRFGYARTLLSGSTTAGRDGVRADLNITRYGGYRDGTNQARESGTLRWDHLLSGTSRLKTVFSYAHIDSPGDGGSEVSRADFNNDPQVNYTPIAFRAVRALRLSAAWEKLGERSGIQVTGYGRYKSLDLLPAWQLTYDPEVWGTSNYSFGLMAQGRHTFSSRASLTAGVDVDVSPGQYRSDSVAFTRPGAIYQSYSKAGRLYGYDVTFIGVSPYLQSEFVPATGVHLSAGVRYDRLGYDYNNSLGVLQTGPHRRPASTTRWFDALSPKLGVTWQATPAVNLFGSWRQSFRVPSQDQLFRQGSAINTVDLDPVRAQSWEVGLRLRPFAPVALEVSAYRMDVKDDVLTFFNTTTFTSETSNAGHTRHQGIEAGLNAGLTSRVQLEVSWSYARHTYEEWVTSTNANYSGNEIESAPRHLGNARLTVRPFGQVARATVEWQYLGGYYTDPGNQHRYGGYDLFNLYTTLPVVAGIDVVGRVNNLANTRYAVTTSFNPFLPAALQDRFRPGLPRTYFIGAQYRFGGKQ
jgi:outer membrane receptor protein involved in Fe transport